MKGFHLAFYLCGWLFWNMSEKLQFATLSTVKCRKLWFFTIPQSSWGCFAPNLYVFYPWIYLLFFYWSIQFLHKRSEGNLDFFFHFWRFSRRRRLFRNIVVRRAHFCWSIVLLSILGGRPGIGQIGGNYCATTLHKSKSKNTSIFKKNYMFMAQRFWIIWIRPLNCTWKTEQMLEITAKVATKSVDSPLIKLCIWTQSHSYLFFVAFHYTCWLHLATLLLPCTKK